MSQLKTLIERTIDIYPQLQQDGGSGGGLDFPSYDLLPRDYLSFAEGHLGLDSPESKINCVSNLKRAMECAMDTFLHILGLDKLAKNRNLSFDQKLAFIEEVEIYKSRSLELLNKTRNKIEHEYAVPELPEIELYFELVYAFVSVIEGAIFMYSNNSELNFSSGNEVRSTFSIEYSHQATEVRFYFPRSPEEGHGLLAHPIGTDDIEDFERALAVYFWIVKGTSVVDKEYVCKRLKAICDRI